MEAFRSACINHNKFMRSPMTSLKFTSKQEKTLYYITTRQIYSPSSMCKVAMKQIQDVFNALAVYAVSHYLKVVWYPLNVGNWSDMAVFNGRYCCVMHYRCLQLIFVFKPCLHITSTRYTYTALMTNKICSPPCNFKI